MQPTKNSRSASERFFGWLQKLLSNRKAPDGSFQTWSNRSRAILTVATIAYFIFLVATIFLLDWWGERNWFLSILLFVPAIVWLAPLLLLTPFQLVVRPKLCWISVAALLVVGFGYLDFHWSFTADENKSGLTLLSNNVGGRKFNTLAEFLKKENPDIIALQDSGQFFGLKKQFPKRFVANVGEYILVSKIPIRQSGLLWKQSYQGRPIGAWHELQYEDQSIVIYNIHMPTPRSEFARLRGRGFLAEIIGGKGIYSREVRKSYREFIEQKIQLTRDLAEILRKEKRPFLVVGDFNMPSHGYLYDLFGSQLSDAFAKKGRGYGFTFPGAIDGWLGIFGSWLRLDYLFAGKNWQVDWYRIESRGVSEHQAVVAHFELKPLKP